VQNLFEALLVDLRVRPTREIPYVVRTQLCGPRLICILHRVIEADREQNDLVALPLLLERCGHLVLDPIAFDRMLRQDQYHLVA
jgi:hypothetical protein